MAKILYEDLTGQSHTIETDVKDIESNDETVVSYVSKRLIQTLLDNNIKFVYYYNDLGERIKLTKETLFPEK